MSTLVIVIGAAAAIAFIIFSVSSMGEVKELESLAKRMPKLLTNFTNTAMAVPGQMVSLLTENLGNKMNIPNLALNETITLLTEVSELCSSITAGSSSLNNEVLNVTQREPLSMIGSSLQVSEEISTFSKVMPEIVQLPASVPIKATSDFSPYIFLPPISPIRSFIKSTEVMPTLDLGIPLSVIIPRVEISTNCYINAVKLPFEALCELYSKFGGYFSKPIGVIKRLDPIVKTTEPYIDIVLAEATTLEVAIAPIKAVVDGIVADFRTFKISPIPSTIPIFNVRGFGGYGGFNNMSDYFNSQLASAIAGGFGGSASIPGPVQDLINNFGGSIPELPFIPSSLPSFGGFETGVDLTNI